MRELRLFARRLVGKRGALPGMRSSNPAARPPEVGQERAVCNSECDCFFACRAGDGANLYQCLGSSPWMRSDPTGLSWDPFSIVDDYIAETAGNRAAFLTAVGQGMKAAAVLGANIALAIHIFVLTI